ncbi:ABC transporter ATP-binding protein [Halobacillus halophilus]|uniref:ABC-type transport system ATP-binding protein n=1 Tax=Halobacillus halophilus (strain ATCC 35676 / DSM 2266 / JCM 20832 / KCTC 3685 / LMG 17431 / NBRC 102448 / NCIMB 2269) TaxID=866895 RepID=I0JKW2_HALH3|nr:ABC transporter ATP-binding protein [Halobacillus halophilus]ASF38908.1 ABC transporter ATP-binding protein [Halobacillus halophilus]CCG44782.1 ABC-type transport system ATP-binding protein [Halobacillus halophilus DSM 2266]
MSKTMIHVEKLVKKYGNMTAVNGVEFNVGAGEVFGLLGPNGAGKTTTIEMLVGLRKPDSGTATLSGFDIRKQINKVKEVIGIQLQSTSLFELLTVHEIMQMYASFYPNHVSIPELIDEMLLTEKKKDRIKALSGGQKQRLAIALAIIHDPAIIFLDEPTTGLDPQARRTLWDIIESLKAKGKTIVLSTHYMDEAHVLCDRIGIMDQGNLIALDTPSRLVKELQSDSAIEFTLHADEDDTFIHHLQRVTQVTRRQEWYVVYTDDLQVTLIGLIQHSQEKNLKLQDLQTRTATLEDVFIHMTGRSLRE